jgi:membrane fusion protein (multidrug efflux system)
MSKIRSFVLFFVFLAMWACHAPEHVEEEQPTFAVTSPLRRDSEITHEYVAQVHAIQHIELRALERGYLEEIFVDEGQHIEAGQPMFQIMPLIYQAEVNKAEAEAELASIEYQNAQLLADKNVIAPSELALAKAKYNSAKAQLSLAKAHRKLTEICAPFSGIMGRFLVRKGSLLDEGEMLTTLADNHRVWVYFNVTEAEYLDYMSTSSAQITQVKLRMANGEVFDEVGTIETIEADFNNETGNIAFRAGFDNPDELLRHGETGKVLMTTPYPGALLIPQKATFDVLDRRYVFVVDDDGVVKTQEISIAAELPNVFIIDAGLDENDHILLEGLRKVRDGDQIEVEWQQPDEVLAHLDLHAE